MNFKIIETSSLLPDVLLYRDRDSDATDSVVILANGTIDGDSDMFATERISFESMEMAIRFIEDFSNASAELWCKKQQITY